MAGTKEGLAKSAAARMGITIEERDCRMASGQKWCTAHKAWHPAAEFPADRSRFDGRKAKCLAADRGKPWKARDPVKVKARRAVRVAVRDGRMASPDDLACLDCGHRGDDRRHEYDHHRGYDEAHRLDVEAVCTLCHATREKARRG